MKTLLMTVLCTLTTAALAQEATPDAWMTDARSTLTRDAVRAEAAAMLRDDAARERMAEGYLPSVAHPRLRAEVLAELYRALESGELDALRAEAHDFAGQPRTSAFAAGRPFAGAR